MKVRVEINKSRMIDFVALKVEKNTKNYLYNQLYTFKIDRGKLFVPLINHVLLKAI